MSAAMERATDSDWLYVGVDVGTGSARAGLFTEKGLRLSTARREIKTWTNSGFPHGSFDQSTEDIWQAAFAAVKVARLDQLYIRDDLTLSTSDLTFVHLRLIISAHEYWPTHSPTKFPMTWHKIPLVMRSKSITVH